MNHGEEEDGKEGGGRNIGRGGKEEKDLKRRARRYV